MRYGILLLGLAFLGCARPDFRDSSLPSEQRAELLLQELTLEEKISLMMDASNPHSSLRI
jgi:beta-glucosidase